MKNKDGFEKIKELILKELQELSKEYEKKCKENRKKNKTILIFDIVEFVKDSIRDGEDADKIMKNLEWAINIQGKEVIFEDDTSDDGICEGYLICRHWCIEKEVE